MHQQVAARGLGEPGREAAAASEALKEELTPPKEEISGPLVQPEEESHKTFASGHPERKLRPLEDVAPSFQSEVQMISLADEAVSPAPETTPESIETTDAEPSKNLVSVGLAACAGESLASSLISSQAIVNMAAEEICAQEELISEGSALVAPPKESISSENTANRDSGGPDIAENFTELASDPLLDPPREQTQVMKPVGTQEQEEEKPDDDQKHSAPLGAELRVSSPDRAPSMGNTDTNPDGAGDEEEGEEEEAELDDKVRKKR